MSRTLHEAPPKVMAFKAGANAATAEAFVRFLASVGWRAWAGERGLQPLLHRGRRSTITPWLRATGGTIWSYKRGIRAEAIQRIAAQDITPEQDGRRGDCADRADSEG